ESAQFSAAQRTSRPFCGTLGPCTPTGGAQAGERLMFDVRRREFIALLGGATVAWPLAARAQQPSMPVIGFVSIRSADDVSSDPIEAFRRGLIEAGFLPGQNVGGGKRLATHQLNRLPAVYTGVGHCYMVV